MDLIDSSSTHASGSRITSMNATSTTWRTIVPIGTGRRRDRTTLITRAEHPEQSADHHQHRRGADPPDCGGVALEPVADLERDVPHVHRPGIGRQCAVKTT